MDLRKVKAVLFDLDGTLLDTVRDIGACVNDVMRRYGCPEHDRVFYTQVIGHGSRNMIARSLPQSADPALLEQVLRFYVPYYREHCVGKTVPFPGTEDFLDWLRRKGYLLGLVTNKTQETAEKIMGNYFPNIPFAILWGNNGIRPLKPDPASGKLACETLHVLPEEVLFVGDGDTDMEFASACGFLACGVTWGYRSTETLLSCGAQMLVSSFSELQNRMEN